MTAGTWDIEIEQGIAFVRTVTYKDSTGTAVNITGYNIQMQIRKYHSSTTLIGDFDNASKGGITITDGAGGKFKIRIPADVTLVMDFSKAIHDVIMTPPGANPDPVRPFFGKVVFKKRATQPNWA